MADVSGAIDDANGKLKLAIFGHIFLSSAAFLIIWLCSYIVIFLYAYGDIAWYWPLLVAMGFLIIGLGYQIRGFKREWHSYSLPFDDMVNGGGYQLSRAYHSTFGAAYAFNAIVMASSGQLLKAVSANKRISLFDKIELAAAQQIVDDLRALGTSPRFHPIDRSWNYTVIAKLIQVELLWLKITDEGPCVVGVNRKLD